MDEKRKYVRIDSSISVAFSIIDSEHDRYTTLSKNVSLGGVMIPLKRQLTIGTKLHLELTLPNESKPISIIGEVVWQKETNIVDSGMLFNTGIKYLEIDSFEMQKLTNYLLMCLGKRLEESKKTFSSGGLSVTDLFTQEIRFPGDKSKTIASPNFLLNEINLPSSKIRYRHLSQNLFFKLQVVSGGDSKIMALDQFISSSGIWLLVGIKIEKGTIVELSINLPDTGGQFFVKAEAILSLPITVNDSSSNKTIFETKLRYIDISGELRRRIMRYIYQPNIEYIELTAKDSPQWKR